MLVPLVASPFFLMILFAGSKGQKGSSGGSSSFAAFSVSRIGGLSATSGNVRITYDTQNLDYGNNINIYDGIFVCDIAGFYYFSFAFETEGDKGCAVRLYKDSTEQIGTFATEKSGRGHIVISQSIVLSLSYGNRVWLELLRGYSFDGTVSANKFNTFNGYLIHAA